MFGYTGMNFDLSSALQKYIGYRFSRCSRCGRCSRYSRWRFLVVIVPTVLGDYHHLYSAVLAKIIV